MGDFPTLSYTSAREIPTLLYTWTEPPRIGHYREYPPPVLTEHGEGLDLQGSVKKMLPLLFANLTI